MKKKYYFCFVNGFPYYCSVEEGRKKYFITPYPVDICLKKMKTYYLSNGPIERPNMKLVWNTLGELVFKCKYNSYYNINNCNPGNNFEKIFTKKIITFMDENPNIFIRRDCTTIYRELSKIVSQTGDHISSLMRLSPLRNKPF